MKDVEDLLKSVVTVDDGLKIISNLEKKQGIGQKIQKTSGSGSASGILDEFKTAFYKLQFVGLTLAINPSSDFLIGLQKWFSNNLGHQVVFDLKVDPQIIGGATIICRDHFRDFSLATRIERKLKDKDNIEEDQPDMMPTALI